MTVSLEDAQARLPDLIDKLLPGQGITIVAQGKALAHVKKAERTSWPCQAGSYKKAEFWMSPDFDAPLEEFKDGYDC